jgi:hypothetical protein
MKKTKKNEIGVSSGNIYLSGSYFFQRIQNHYPVASQPQCATASIAIKSDKFSGDISRIVLDFIYTGKVAGTSEYEFTNPPIIIDFQDYDQIVYKAVRIPVPISQIAAWTFMLKNVPKASYYISYEVGPTRSYAFLIPVANTLHTIGQ